MLFEIFGWAAAFLTFLTYYQKTMVRLRVLGVLSNMCFISWGIAFEVYPVLVLHAVLLPVNLFRFAQIQRMKRGAIKAVAGTVSPLEWLRPMSKPMSYEGGDYVFRIGDAPDRLYYLVSGRVVFEELGKAAGPGELFGEVAFLTSKRQRTASARCEGPCEVFALDAGDLATLSLQHPAFNVYVMRVIAERLTGGEIPLTAASAPFADLGQA